MSRNYKKSMRDEMMRDLHRAYSEVVSDCWTQAEAWRRTVCQPAPRFYVKARQAHQVLCPMLKGDFTAYSKMRPLRRKMYDDMYDVVMRLSRKREYQGMSLLQIMPFVVTSPAKQFYISTEWLRKMFQNERLRGVYNKYS